MLTLCGRSNTDTWVRKERRVIIRHLRPFTTAGHDHVWENVYLLKLFSEVLVWPKCSLIAVRRGVYEPPLHPSTWCDPDVLASSLRWSSHVIHSFLQQGNHFKSSLYWTCMTAGRHCSCTSASLLSCKSALPFSAVLHRSVRERSSAAWRTESSQQTQVKVHTWFIAEQ